MSLPAHGRENPDHPAQSAGRSPTLIMPDLIPVLTKSDIRHIVKRLGQQISLDYQGREPILIAVLKGSFVFLSDLIRQLTIPVKIDFLRAASYGADTTSSGKIELTKEIELNIQHQDVLIVEDIVDTGLTLTRLVDYLGSFGPRSIKICTLIDKKERRLVQTRIDYVGQTVAEGFLVGYGLDYAEGYRNLPDIYHLEF
jgi:hypoxanthine phosphoribosyltransferase